MTSVYSKDIENLLNFLKVAEENGITDWDDIFLREAWRRYETLWIPLVRKHKPEPKSAIPPLDVHWMWHVHLLNPHAYHEDLAKSGEIIDHRYADESSRYSKDLWNSEYPNEPFDNATRAKEIPLSEFESSFRYNLIEASKRQSKFYYQVSLSHYRNKEFQYECITRYTKFLKLKGKYPREFFVPYYDIDIAWHAHMSKPLLYNLETKNIFGKMLSHDDSVSNVVLGNSLENTAKLWKEEFHSDYVIPGVCHRGESPKGRLTEIPECLNSTSFLLTKDRRFTIDSPIIYKFPIKEFKDRDYLLSLKICCSNRYNDFTSRQKHKPIFAMKNCQRKAKQENVIEPGGAKFSLEGGNCVIQAESYSTLHVDADVYKRYQPNKLYEFFFGIRKNKHITSTKNVNSAFDPSEINHLQRSIQMINGGKLEIGLTPIPGSSTKVQYKILHIRPGSFYDCIIPENIESLWGPIPLDKLPPGVDNRCKAVVHDILDTKTGQKVFTVHLVHSLPLNMSSIQVFYGADRMTVAHLVGPKTIGNHQFSEYLKLFKSKPWRALILKDDIGDWGLLVGSWEGAVRSTPGKRPDKKNRRGRRPKPGKPGYFMCNFFNLRSGESTAFVLPRKSVTEGHGNKYSFEIPGKLYANLQDGEIILLNNVRNEVLQHVTLSFAMSLLYLMVLPQPKSENADKINKTIPAKYRPLYYDSFDSSFFVYCGLSNMRYLPTNSNLYHIYHGSCSDGMDSDFGEMDIDVEFTFMDNCNEDASGPASNLDFFYCGADQEAEGDWGSGTADWDGGGADLGSGGDSGWSSGGGGGGDSGWSSSGGGDSGWSSSGGGDSGWGGDGGGDSGGGGGDSGGGGGSSCGAASSCGSSCGGGGGCGG